MKKRSVARYRVSEAKRIYQQGYRELFDLIMTHGITGWHSERGVEIRQKMDHIPVSEDLKQAWGLEVGWVLYERRINRTGDGA